MKSWEDMTPEEQEDAMYEAAIMSAGDMGTPRDMFHPEYGWILLKGEVTDAGKKFYEDNKEYFEKSRRE